MRRIIQIFIASIVLGIATCGSYAAAKNQKVPDGDNPAAQIAAVYEKGARRMEKAKTQQQVLSIFLETDEEATKIAIYADRNFKPTPAQQRMADQAYLKFRKALKEAQNRCKD